MALDLAAMRAKLAKLSGKGNDAMVKLEEGENTLRIIPLVESPDNPFLELFFHYGLGGKNWLSPQSYGERDPIAEFADALMSGQRLTKEEFKEAVKFRPQARTYALVINRAKENEGPKFWSFGQTIYKKLLEIMADEDYGDITDIQNGFDLKVTYTPKEKSDTNYAKTDVMPRRTPSPLSKDAELVKKWTTNQAKLLDVVGFEKKSYDELKAVLERVLNPEGTPSIGTIKGGNTASSASAETTATADTSEWDAPPAEAPKAEASVEIPADVNAQFDALFNE
jgi:hypothetical protein